MKAMGTRPNLSLISPLIAPPARLNGIRTDQIAFDERDLYKLYVFPLVHDETTGGVQQGTFRERVPFREAFLNFVLRYRDLGSGNEIWRYSRGFVSFSAERGCYSLPTWRPKTSYGDFGDV